MACLLNLNSRPAQLITPFSLRIFVADGDPDGLGIVERSNWALMASPNSPTHGHPKFPQAAPSDYDPSAWMAKRAAASLSL
jgi:hypothetical protein